MAFIRSSSFTVARDPTFRRFASYSFQASMLRHFVSNWLSASNKAVNIWHDVGIERHTWSIVEKCLIYIQ